MIERLKEFIVGGCKNPELYEDIVYPLSVNHIGNSFVFMVKSDNCDYIVADYSLGFKGEDFGSFLLCKLNHENAICLRRLFPYTAPSRVLKENRSFGVGDRLGIATNGHIKAFLKFDAYPVFAQQSIRELKLTNRNYDEVLDSVSYSVFRHNFRRPFGADGDHLKTFEEIEYALNCGYTMITLDCSEYIRNDVSLMSDSMIENAYIPNPKIEEQYLGKHFAVGDVEISFNKNELMRISLIYDNAIDFITEVYNKYFSLDDSNADFEVSIDETTEVTTLAQHFYVAHRLISNGVRPISLAPRFVGEFQKGIDYIGNVNDFEKELRGHVAIAKHFGYKISVHSGSDKFSVFNAIGKCTNGYFHVKTSGTSWLEAMAVISIYEPKLFREILEYAMTVFEEAKKYYHVTADLNRLPGINTLKDKDLIGLFEQNDARQLMHITYGYILNKKDCEGKYTFRDRLYSCLRKYAEEYENRLEKHIGHHLEMLCNGIEE